MLDSEQKVLIMQYVTTAIYLITPIIASQQSNDRSFRKTDTILQTNHYFDLWD